MGIDWMGRSFTCGTIMGCACGVLMSAIIYSPEWLKLKDDNLWFYTRLMALTTAFYSVDKEKCLAALESIAAKGEEL